MCCQHPPPRLDRHPWQVLTERHSSLPLRPCILCVALQFQPASAPPLPSRSSCPSLCPQKPGNQDRRQERLLPSRRASWRNSMWTPSSLSLSKLLLGRVDHSHLLGLLGLVSVICSHHLSTLGKAGRKSDRTHLGHLPRPRPAWQPHTSPNPKSPVPFPSASLCDRPLCAQL